ncbi:5-deoxy-glucuronate isomerase [Streptomyces sp. NPDC059629]|uniref:5-deoxy-glucuronate isomerase n=1 Tax=Streptomyces sp. NPDC059629 TaxID=3346889 RepID=UPI003677A762
MTESEARAFDVVATGRTAGVSYPLPPGVPLARAKGSGALHRPAGTARRGPYAVDVSPENAGWGFSALRVLELAPGGSHTFAPARYGTAASVPVELRGRGGCSPQVNGFGAADGFGCDRLFAVEVLTPGGNWSSFPPHKHDEYRPGAEPALEEIYHFEFTDHEGGPGLGYQRVSPSGRVMAGPDPERVRRISDHPDHARIRPTWPEQPVDPCLPPYTTPSE